MHQSQDVLCFIVEKWHWGKRLPPPLPPRENGAGGTLHQIGLMVFETLPNADEPHNCILCNCIFRNCTFQLNNTREWVRTKLAIILRRVFCSPPSSLLLLWAAAAKTYKRKGYCIFRCKREKWTQLGGYHLRRAYKSGVTSTKGAQGLMINTKFYPICRVRESMWSKITKALRYIFPENWQKQSPI